MKDSDDPSRCRLRIPSPPHPAGCHGVRACAGALGASNAWAATTYVVVNCDTLNVRTGPGTSYAIVGTLAVGSVITATAAANGWVQIASGTFAGRYCSGSYLLAGGSTTTPTPTPAPSGYVTRITPVAGGVYLRRGWTGTRVYLTQKRLGMERYGADQVYDSTTEQAVIAFQRSKGLSATGVVDPTTWTALATGYSFTSDAYQVQPRIGLTATASARIEAMIAHALAQRGSRYTWGGAGPFALGFDCSGLALQSVYAGGRDPQPISVLKHAEPGFTTSKALYEHSGFQTIPVAQRRRGDLVFYRNAAGNIFHVAINLGDGTLMEAAGRYAATRAFYSTTSSGGSVAAYVKRPFW